jgi:signal peptidase I
MATATATATATESEDEKDKKKHPRDPAREVVETVVFVVVLVLLLKLFVTEAFVIPTGSMAETLYGYQKIIVCPKCGHEFPVNAHDEVEPNQNTGQRHPLFGYCCPNCRFVGRVADLNPVPTPRTGDRVLVLKPLYHLRSPQRGDVVVFKYPEKPQENHIAANYIKRAMGFGSETIAIHRGELFVTTSLTYPDDNPLYPRPDDPLDLWKPEYRYANSAQAETLFRASRDAGFTDKVPGGFQIVRKNEAQLLADRRIVWDNDKQPTDPAGRWPRWNIVGDQAPWKPDNPSAPRAFSHAGGNLDWIRYQHLVWRADKGKGLAPWRWGAGETGQPVAGPVDNMLGYNAGIDFNPVVQQPQARDRDSADAQRWVGDLVLECEVELSGGSAVVLELSKGANRFQAKFGDGEVALARVGPGAAEFGNPKQPCKVREGTYKLRFANVDHRLWVWVDDKRIDFGPAGDYSPVEVTSYEPEDKDNKEGWTRANDVEAPASIGARGPVAKVAGIKLSRDIYYTRGGGEQTEADIFYVQPGHYLCLGDNSAQSSDSRRWGAVPERLMLGKAVFVFWPAFPHPNRVGFIK